MTRLPILVVALVACLATVAAAGSKRPGLCDTAAGAQAAPPYIGVFSAFPAELVPLLEATTIDDEVEIDGRRFFIGRLGGVNVVLSLMGIGMVNARASTERLLANFDIAGIIVSGVAGSQHNIGDVVVARSWQNTSTCCPPPPETGRSRVWKINQAMLALAERVVTRLPEPFDTCTPVPPTDPEAPLVCMPHTPALVFEERGESGDPFGGNALACIPGGGEVLGCEIPFPPLAAPLLAAAMTPVVPDVADEETAAVVRVAVRKRVPMVGVRAVSDGAGDPKGDRGFPLQFFDYYRLAAINAAVVTRGILGELGAFAADPDATSLCRRLDKRRWRSAAELIRSAP